MSATFLDRYFEQYRELAFAPEAMKLITEFCDIAGSVRQHRAKMAFMGNGASASCAEHGAVDFTKQGKVRSVTFHDPNLITCFANDFGYDNWMAKAVEHYCDELDVVVLISVSGVSPSVVNAAKTARERGHKIVSFTGRSPGNPLRALSDIGFHVPSDAYNVVECIHMMWLTATIDLLIGASVYETRDVAI